MVTEIQSKMNTGGGGDRSLTLTENSGVYNGMKCTLYLWRAHPPHGATDTLPLIRGYILQQSAVVLNDGLPNLYNSHSEGCKVAAKIKEENKVQN